MTTRWQVPRETKEWLGPVTYTPTDATLELLLLPRGVRPADDAGWAAPLELDGGKGLLMNDKTPGEYYLWAALVDQPERPVLLAGIVTVT